VAIISPGRWMAGEELDTAAARLKEFGFRVHLHPQNFLRQHQFAGTVEERLNALHDVFKDKDVRAVMLAKAGYGALHLLDSIDDVIIANNPKILVGYSDATALLMALFLKVGLVTFHGPMLYDLRNGADHKTWQWFQEILLQGGSVRLDTASVPQIRVLRPGSGAGQLLGGNLTLLTHLIGTSTDFDSTDRILFLEDYDEKLYALDRLMLHLRRAGKLQRLQGLLIGEMHKIADDQIPFGQSVDEIVMSHCSGTHFPIISNCPFGHGAHQLILPIGIPAALSADAASFEFESLCPAVS